MGQIIKGKIYLEYMYVANIFTEKKKKNSLKTSARKKNSEGKEPTEINIPGPIEY